MKPWIRYKNDSIPGDLENIMQYLEKRGKIMVSKEKIGELYCSFSEDVYCAGWMKASKPIMFEFSEWLEEIEI